VIDVIDHTALAQVWVGQHLGGVEDSSPVVGLKISDRLQALTEG
jgi:hypothetical protein